MNLGFVNFRGKVPALLPVYLLHKMLIVLRVCVGYEGARSNVAFRKHLSFCHIFKLDERHLKGGVCDDLEGHDVVAIWRDRRRIEAVLAFRDLNSAVIDHLPGSKIILTEQRLDLSCSRTSSTVSVG